MNRGFELIDRWGIEASLGAPNRKLTIILNCIGDLMRTIIFQEIQSKP